MTFNEANQAKLSLKMSLSNYAWYKSSFVGVDGSDWIVVVNVRALDDKVRKTVPIVHHGVSVRTVLNG
jgi:hypothetical protein